MKDPLYRTGYNSDLKFNDVESLLNVAQIIDDETNELIYVNMFNVPQPEKLKGRYLFIYTSVHIKGWFFLKITKKNC